MLPENAKTVFSRSLINVQNLQLHKWGQGLKYFNSSNTFNQYFISVKNNKYLLRILKIKSFKNFKSTMSKKLFLIYSLKLFVYPQNVTAFSFIDKLACSSYMSDCTKSPSFQIFVTLDRKFLCQPLGISFQKAKRHFKARCWGTRNLSSSIHQFSNFHIQGKGKVGNILYAIREVVSPFQANRKLKYTKTHIGSWEEKNINTRTARLQLPGRFKHTNISMQACSRGKGSTLMFGR